MWMRRKRSQVTPHEEETVVKEEGVKEMENDIEEQ